MFFSVITKNLNWDTLTKNFKLLLKDRMGLRTKNYNIMGVHWKIWFLVGFMKNQYIAGNLLERGAWTVCRFKGGLEKRGGWCFWGRGVDTPMHTMWLWWIVFVVWLTSERHLALFLASTIEILIIANFWDATSRIWTCAEPDFRFCWMKLWSRDNHFTLVIHVMHDFQIFSLLLILSNSVMHYIFFSKHKNVLYS